MLDNIFVSMLLSVGFLVMVASLLAETRLMRQLLQDNRSLGNQLLLALIFGLVSILSTYTGVQVQGAIVNTRVIGVLAAGLLGGPIVGLGAAFIGGLHRYLFDIGGFTAIACAVSTFFEGLMGVLAHWNLRRHRGKLKNKNLSVALLTAGAEIAQMLIILIIAKPFDAAVQLVGVISLPMILLNSFGMVMFISVFDRLFREREQEAAVRQGLVLAIAEQCLPHLRSGLQNREEIKRTVEIICNYAPEYQVIVTDLQQVLADSGGELLSAGLPDIAKEAMKQIKTIVRTSGEERALMIPGGSISIAAPLTYQGTAIGALVLLVQRRWQLLAADIGFIQGLARLFSTMLELSELEHQKRLRRRAEFRALQAQINPHFFYNALNTLSSVSRENPERIRGLLLAMADYFRHMLEINQEQIPLQEELKAVENYLTLEEARFEESLLIEWKIEKKPDYMVPPLILQPIVENAVKHGISADGKRRVTIGVKEQEGELLLTVEDEGPGFHPQIVEQLLKDDGANHYSGLFNVHRRLQAMYGKDHGLCIASAVSGSKVTLAIPIQTADAIKSTEERSESHADSSD